MTSKTSEASALGGPTKKNQEIQQQQISFYSSYHIWLCRDDPVFVTPSYLPAPFQPNHRVSSIAAVSTAVRAQDLNLSRAADISKECLANVAVGILYLV